MNITDIKASDIITQDTSVAYQWRSHSFEDIPDQIIGWCRCMDKHDLVELATAIANGLLDEIFTAALDTENAQSFAVQAVEAQNQPTLLSDY